MDKEKAKEYILSCQVYIKASCFLLVLNMPCFLIINPDVMLIRLYDPVSQSYDGGFGLCPGLESHGG